MFKSDFNYNHNQKSLLGYLTYDDRDSKSRPAVLVVHDWSGRNDFACQKADMLAEMGYLSFAVDMFGDAKVGETVEEKQSLILPFLNDRQLLIDRMMAAFNVVRDLPQVDPSRIAAIGFCFGGLCVLDLARTGVGMSGVVSFHGLLNKPESLSPNFIKAKILALHGYADPMVKPDQVNSFCNEMNEAKADWQVHMYGNVQHAFTNPNANDQSLGTIYNSTAEKRSMESMTNFLSEIFKRT